MAIDFNNPNNTARLSKPTISSSHNSAQTNTIKNNSDTTAKSASAGEPVQLSKDARQLQSLTDKIAAQPQVNAEKVAQLKQAIAEGSYQIDNQRVADKLLGLEAQFWCENSSLTVDKS